MSEKRRYTELTRSVGIIQQQPKVEPVGDGVTSEDGGNGDGVIGDEVTETAGPSQSSDSGNSGIIDMERLLCGGRQRYGDTRDLGFYHLDTPILVEFKA